MRMRSQSTLQKTVFFLRISCVLSVVPVVSSQGIGYIAGGSYEKDIQPHMIDGFSSAVNMGVEHKSVFYAGSALAHV